MDRDSRYRILLPVAVAGGLAALALADLRLAAVAGLFVALWMFARSVMALLK